MLGRKENGTAVSDGQTLNTIIGRGTLFEGTMQVVNSVRIDGKFKGALSCSGALTISQSGEAYAHLEGKEIYINGNVRGTVRAEKVRLDSQARFIGDIHSVQISINQCEFSAATHFGDFFHLKLTKIIGNPKVKRYPLFLNVLNLKDV